ncbi:MAG TPA: glycosyltransferase family 39 protein [Ktedonobacterales bacterium]
MWSSDHVDERKWRLRSADDPGDHWLRRIAVSRAQMIEWGAMLTIVALALTLDFWGLAASGYGNLYYAAAVRSMAESWHNFLFAAYDPGGFVTVDKPPLGFWAQVLSVKLLGFSSFSLLLPEALAGALSVVALWRIARRAFGPVAGALAALALAITPISVVVNRDNILEPTLTLTALLAAWAIGRAVERGALRWLLISAAFVGLGFNIKMLEAYLIVPALALVYLLCAPGARGKRLRRLTLAGALMVALSFSWIAFVDLTPAAQRPYVGSTTANSELELALGYNGSGRLLGGQTLTLFGHALTNGYARPHHAARPPQAGGATPRQSSADGRAPVRLPAHHPSPVGAPGSLRLVQAPLGSQISWELPLALGGLLLAAIAALSAVAERRDRPQALRELWSVWRRSPRTHGLLLWGAWLGAEMLLFSFARSINDYYVAVLAPAICALAGMGAVELWRVYLALFQRRERDGWLVAWRGLLLPLALLATVGLQATLLGAAPRWTPWLAPALLASALGLAALLVSVRLSARLAARPARRLASALAMVALAVTLIAPTGWTLSSLTPGNEGGWPSAGPQFASAPTKERPLVDPAMMRYLLQHRGEDRFLVGALNAYITAPIIIATGQPVLDMGGFTGNDPILTDRLLQRIVTQDQAHLFLLPSTNVTAAQLAALFPPPARRGAARLGKAAVAGSVYTNSLTRWISIHCTPVPPSQWSSTSVATHRLGAFELFACQT